MVKVTDLCSRDAADAVKMKTITRKAVFIAAAFITAVHSAARQVDRAPAIHGCRVDLRQVDCMRCC